MNRRLFIQTLAVQTLSLYMRNPSVAASRRVSVGICLSDSPELGRNQTTPNGTGLLLRVFPEDFRAEEIPLPIRGHSILQNPKRPSQAIVLMKWGKSLAEIDLVRRQVVRVVTAEKNKRFYGHGLFEADGASYHCVEYNDQTKASSLVERGASGHHIVREIPTYGTHSHEVRLNAEGSSFIFANEGAKKFDHQTAGGADVRPCITTVDRATGQLVRRYVFSKPGGPAHFVPVSKSSVLALGGFANQQSLVAKIDLDGKINQLTVSTENVGQVFGAALAGNVAWLTLPEANLLLSVDLSSGRVLSQHPRDRPRSIFKPNQGSTWLANGREIEIFAENPSRPLKKISTKLSISGHFDLLLPV